MIEEHELRLCKQRLQLVARDARHQEELEARSVGRTRDSKLFRNAGILAPKSSGNVIGLGVWDLFMCSPCGLEWEYMVYMKW